MRLVEWQDQRGLKHRSFVRDGDPDYLAPEGVSQDPPSLELLDWEAIRVELHNALIDRGLISWLDVQQQQSGVSSAILSVLKNRVVRLYREAANNEAEGG